MEAMTIFSTAPLVVVKHQIFPLQKLSFWFAPTTRPPGCDSANGSGFYDLCVPFKGGFGGFGDGVGLGKKKKEEKAMVAMKNHCEAERRRRERINAHLNTLRGLVPSVDKMDKASLLAAVITQVKELKKTAAEASKGFLVPTDANEVRIEPFDSGAGDGTLYYFRASLCCDYRPELLTDLRQALNALKLKLVKVEVSTLGGRVKVEFVLSSCKEGLSNDSVSDAQQLLVASIHRTLTSVVDKSSALEYSPRSTTLPKKKRRISLDSSNSSSRDL